ncbi:MAG TPA: hypothetical protein VFZ81_14805, partial [Burkholderiales bacterium]
VLIPSFEPNAGTVATLMGGQSSRHPAVRREAKPERKKPPADPIFSKPYEPSPAANTEPKPAEAPRSKRKQPQVAALLGGLKRA